MLVAITESAQSGTKPVIELREAVDEAAAVSAYCSEISPPRSESSYSGHDAGAGLVAPIAFARWSWSFTSNQFVQTPSYAIKVRAQGENLCTFAPIDTQDWKDLGGAVGNPVTVCDVAANAVGYAHCSARADGAGAQIRAVYEDDQGNDVACCPAQDIATGNQWAVHQLWSSVELPAGLRAYKLQGRLGGATSAEVRFAATYVFEKVSA